MRRLGSVTAVGLTLYGGVLTGAGLLVKAGVFDPTDDADERALAWHAYFWDPWFPCGAPRSRCRCGAAGHQPPHELPTTPGLREADPAGSIAAAIHRTVAAFEPDETGALPV
jgi:hypothetical protein